MLIWSSSLFIILRDKAPYIKRVLDTSAANRLYMKNVYEDDVRLSAVFSERLKKGR